MSSFATQISIMNFRVPASEHTMSMSAYQRRASASGDQALELPSNQTSRVREKWEKDTAYQRFCSGSV